MPPIEAVLVGAGERGRRVIGEFALSNPAVLRITAVAEPDEVRRDQFAEAHGIAPENRFAHYEELLSRPQIAPLCFNTSMDRQHLPSALQALEAGYDLFLEKPMAHTASACLAIAETARRLGRMIQICHPLRFTPFYTRVRALIESGALGRPITLTMVENIAHWHFAHSYVRGNWSQVETSGPMILTKCCHDMDLAAWLTGQSVRRVASFGSRSHFTEANAPEGAPERCTDGCPVESTCPHFAPAVYLTDNIGWPTSVISNDPSPEARRRALETGPYGRCVFRAPNTAVDHQVVSAEFEDGTTLTFSARAFTAECFRTIRVLGTEGELNGHLERADLTVTRFTQGIANRQIAKKQEVGPVEGTHLGGDPAVIRHFLRCWRDRDLETLQRGLDIALEGHLLAFAAERARETGQVVDMETFRREVSSQT
ncbi:Gfo/Idh/MocA family oxidoreductase [Candidatus Sumerlaeota bacterium]|nr:Gfo/Idh/MocA family oxidoreductase [Candidatus Sumerlaeota bacterium]